MRKITLYISLFVLIVACTPDKEEFIPSINDSSLESLLEELKGFSDVVTVDPLKGTDVITANESIISIPSGGIVDASGSVILEEVTLEYIEILDQSLMTIYGFNTVSNQKMLETAFAYYLRFTYNGDEVFIDPEKSVTIRVPSQEYGGIMYTFSGIENVNCIDWALNGDYNNGNIMAESIEYGEYDFEDLNGESWSDFGYIINTSMDGWISLSRYFSSDAVENADLCATVPEEIGENTSSVFLVFKDISSVLKLDNGTNSLSYCDIMGIIPKDQDAFLVSLTGLSDDNYYLGLEEIITGERNTFTILPVRKNKEEILDILGML